MVDKWDVKPRAAEDSNTTAAVSMLGQFRNTILPELRYALMFGGYVR